MTEESIKNRNKAAAGAQAVMGGTEESVAATKAANSKALSDATAQIATNGEQRKDAIENQFQERDTSLNNQLNEIEQNKANAIGQAVQGVTGAAGNIPF